MRRTLAFIGVFALMISMLAMPATADDLELSSTETTVTYTGQGFTNGELDSPKCGGDADLGQDKGWVIADDGGYLKWVLTAAGADSATITGPWGTFDMIQVPGEQGVFHKATDYYPVGALIDFPVTATYVGNVTGNVQLVVSNGCPGDEPFVPEGVLNVEKTAETSYTREHFWDIAKKVETKQGFTHGEDDLPKIWLYTDGSGDEKAKWTVDVTYEGKEDSAGKVTGEITISLGGNLDAYITSVTDYLDLGVQEVAATIDECLLDTDQAEILVTFPYLMTQGSPDIICKYSASAPIAGGTNFANVAGEFQLPAGIEVKYEPEAFDEQATAPVVFGDPTTEINKTVNVEDISDLFGEVALGKVTAPNGAQFTYKKSFAWADYGQDLCGDYQYDNTASIVETEQEADASLLVNVQCFVFDGETAWAANANKPLELRYTNRGNWATYVKYQGFEDAGKTTTLFAGQTIEVGTVTFSEVVDGNVTITVDMTAPWEFEEVSENLKVQDYAAAPSGNPSPGLFDHKKDCDPDESTCSIMVPANNYYGVHVNVGQWIPDPEFGP